jgi:hypothetical protein
VIPSDPPPNPRRPGGYRHDGGSPPALVERGARVAGRRDLGYRTWNTHDVPALLTWPAEGFDGIALARRTTRARPL